VGTEEARKTMLKWAEDEGPEPQHACREAKTIAQWRKKLLAELIQKGNSQIETPRSGVRV